MLELNKYSVFAVLITSNLEVITSNLEVISSNFEVIGSRTALEMFGTVPQMFGTCAKNKGRCAINWMKLVTSKGPVKDWPRPTAQGTPSSWWGFTCPDWCWGCFLGGAKLRLL